MSGSRPLKSEMELSALAAVESNARLTHLASKAIESEEPPTLGDAERASLIERLIAEFHPVVYRYLYWLTHCSATAEDITQEVFTRAFRGLHNLREVEAAKGWLLTIARNEFSRWCSKKRIKTVGVGADGESAMDLSQAVAIEEEPEADNVEWVRQGLCDLNEEFRVVLMMYYYEQKSYAEIAEVLRIPIGTVMSRLNRGRSKLKQALARLAEPAKSDTGPSENFGLSDSGESAKS